MKTIRPVFRHRLANCARHLAALAVGLWTFFGPLSARTTDAAGDSLSRRAALLAARGNTAELRPLFAASGQDFAPYVRLYCEMALARADHDWGRVVSCIDSLKTGYSYQFDIKGLLSLSLLKGETLHRTGQYAELADYCRNEIAYYRRRHVKTALLDPFRDLQKKGKRLRANDERTQVLRLADLDKATDLYAQFGKRLTDFDAYTALRARLTLASAYNRPNVAAGVADTLMRQFADSLTDEDYSLCVRTAAQALMVSGEWQKLGGLTAAATRSGRTVTAPLAGYSRMATTLADYTPTTVERPAGDVVLPVTYVWPPLVSGQAGEGEACLFNLNTSQPHTLITAADAQASGVRPVADTLEIVSDLGLIKVSPALVERLVFGDIVMRNVLVYVVTDSLDTPAELVRTLGFTELARLGTLDYCGEKLIVRAAPAAATNDETAANLHLTADGNLLLTGTCGDKDYHFLCSSGYPMNLISPKLFEEAQADTTTFSLLVGGTPTLPTDVGVENTQRLNCDGILGQAFLLDNHRVRFDFDRMTLSILSGPSPDADAASPFFMLRNLPAYDLTYDDVWSVYDYPLTGALLTNRPEAVDAPECQLSADDLKALTADDRLALRLMQQSAWIQTGDYAKAAAVDTKGMSAEMRKRQMVYKSFPAQAKPRLAMERQTAVVYTDTTTFAMPVIVNGREATMRPDLSLAVETPIVLSSKMAKKLKVKPLYSPKDKTAGNAYGLIDSLRLGEATIYNVLCLIEPGKGTDARYGLGVLRHFAAVTFRKKLLILQPNSVAGSQAARMVLTGGLLVEGETPSGYTTFALRTPESQTPVQRVTELPLTLAGQTLPDKGRFEAGAQATDAAPVTLSLTQLTRDFGSVTLDFGHMRLKLR